MKIRNLMFAAAAGSLVSAPVALQAAAPLDRATMPSEGASEMGGQIGPALIIVALAAAGMLALLLTDDDDDDFAVSP